jgi:hypothetical protein
MVLEAVFELAIARVHTLASAKHFTSLMGELEGRPIAANPDQQAHASRVGYVVEQTARVMPFRCVCLQQVLAARRMLRRRHLPATVYLGVLPEEMPSPMARTSISEERLPGTAAHAWITSGDKVINGNSADLGKYVILGTFS